MYETYTYDFILNRMLARVPDDMDKREGSPIYDALAPAAAELAQLYAELDINRNLASADTATGEYLSQITAQHGVNRQAATAAKRTGLFFDADETPFNVPIGGRYGIDDLTYVVIEQTGTGIYTLESEMAGIVGNQRFGSLLPISYVDGLVRAELSDVIVAGEDDEDDETLRARYFKEVNEPAFGGNVADYKKKIGDIDGVGAVKVFPVWNGGGTVKATIIASDWSVASAQLVTNVQTAVDPPAAAGEGAGTAPIGHQVTITGVQGVAINLVTTVTLASGVTVAQVQADIEAAIAAYLLELRKDWANQTQLIIRVAQIDARILTVNGVDDVTGTQLNGSAENVVLTDEQMPVLGTVTIN